MMAKRTAVIFDIDGTLALRVDRSPYNWAAVGSDRPNRPVIACLRALAAQGMKIFIFSGRDAVCETETRAWLIRHGVPDGFSLLMRDRGSCEPDQIVKRRMLQIALSSYDVLCAFDDRKRVKRMWVENGIFVFDVNQLDEEF